jgi:N-acetylglucosamine-6-phosphate deacetylase
VILAGARVVTLDRVIEPGWIGVEGERITGVGEGAPPAGGQVRDLGGAWLLPGFIDLHMHGGGGYSVGESPEATRRAVAFHREHGTTRTLAGFVTAPLEQLAEAVAWTAHLVAAGPTADGHIVGSYLEGPFLSRLRCGAQNPSHLRRPDTAELGALLDAGRGTVRMVTVAPELPGGLDLIRLLAARGVVPAIGHTDADYDTAAAAVAAGARVLTHAFNGMRGMHHRQPGPVGAVAREPGTVLEVINDGMHVHAAVIGLLSGLGPGRLAFITDAMAAAGAGDGTYSLGGAEVRVVGGRAELAQGGALAGSTLTMDGAVRRAVKDVGIPIWQAAAAASHVPAGVLGLRDRCGRLAAGLDADLVVMDDRLTVSGVMALGRWSRGPFLG